jgi:hypothetical protein
LLLEAGVATQYGDVADFLLARGSVELERGRAHGLQACGLCNVVLKE